MSEKNQTVAMKPGDSVSFFQLKQEIGIGGFGSVWLVQSTEDNLFYAMKIEPIDSKKKTLNFEATMLKKLQPSEYFPKVVLDGVDNDHNFLVMELCGPNLSTVSSALPNAHFSHEYIYKMADDMLQCIEHLHAQGYIHRDIKPQNFVTKFKGKAAVCLLDYGISKMYCDPKTGQHLEARDHVSIAGSPMFASPNNHDRIEQSRRDDMYSWLYTVCSLCEVGLPWKQEDGIQEIGELKKKNPVSQLVEPLGEEMVEIAKHIEALKYDEAPNYTMIHTLLNKKHTSMNTEVPYQWMTLQPINPERFKKLESKKPEYTTLFSGNNLDPTQFLMSLTKYDEVYHSSCLLI